MRRSRNHCLTPQWVCWQCNAFYHRHLLTVAKTQTAYFCSDCGHEASKWAGQCAGCGAWNSLREAPSAKSRNTKGGRGGGYTGQRAEVQSLGSVAAETTARKPSGLDELDRVLGGGLVPGAVILLGGDPGIGKSTLLLQLLAALTPDLPGLYVTGEESPAQVQLRAQRLGLAGASIDLLAETNIEAIVQAATAGKPGVLVVDSIQTIYAEALDSAPGSVSQVRETAAQLVRFAKATNTAVVLVGHVTKEGAIAGPRVLEHMVDTVLYFEGDAAGSDGRYRMIRAVKNRFGAVNELGIFAMTDAGLKPVGNPSAIFLARGGAPVPGSAVTVMREGTRPLLVECQALVDLSHLGNPRRVAVGVDGNRIAMLLAVLHRHAGVVTADQDVFVNIVGGVRVTETAADLAVLAAALSSLRDKPLPQDTVIFGEVGLSGEIRPVPGGEERLAEAAKHGFKRAIVPAANAPRKGKKIGDMQVVGVQRMADVLDALS